jgi:hypothetical protein
MHWIDALPAQTEPMTTAWLANYDGVGPGGPTYGRPAPLDSSQPVPVLPWTAIGGPQPMCPPEPDRHPPAAGER